MLCTAVLQRTLPIAAHGHVTWSHAWHYNTGQSHAHAYALALALALALARAQWAHDQPRMQSTRSHASITHARARTHAPRRAGPTRDHRHWATRSRKDDDTSTHSSEQAELTRRSCRQVHARAGVCIDHGHSWFHSRGDNKMRVVEIPSVFAFAHNEGPAVPKHPASQEETCAGGCMIELTSTHFHSRRRKKLRVVEISSPIALADNQGLAVHKHPAFQEET